MKKFIRKHFLAIMLILGVLAFISYNQNINLDTKTLAIVGGSSSEGYRNICEAGTLCALAQDPNYKTESSSPTITSDKPLDILSSGNAVGSPINYRVRDTIGGKFTLQFPANELQLIYWCDEKNGNSLTKDIEISVLTGENLQTSFTCTYNTEGTYNVRARYVAVYKNPSYPYYTSHPNGEGVLWMGDSVATKSIIGSGTQTGFYTCTSGEKRCGEYFTNKYIQTCQSNKWVTIQDCGNGYCNYQSEDYRCVASTSTVTPPANSNPSTIPPATTYICSDGSTRTTNDCPVSQTNIPIVQNNITASCPTQLPSPSVWGECNIVNTTSGGEKIRTEYYCDSTTNYQPKEVFRTAPCTPDNGDVNKCSGTDVVTKCIDDGCGIKIAGCVLDNGGGSGGTGSFPIIYIIVGIIVLLVIIML